MPKRAGGHGARREHHVEVRVGGATTVSVQHRPSDVEHGKVDVRFERAVGLRRRLADHRAVDAELDLRVRSAAFTGHAEHAARSRGRVDGLEHDLRRRRRRPRRGLGHDRRRRRGRLGRRRELGRDERADHDRRQDRGRRRRRRRQGRSRRRLFRRRRQRGAWSSSMSWWWTSSSVVCGVDERRRLLRRRRRAIHPCRRAGDVVLGVGVRRVGSHRGVFVRDRAARRRGARRDRDRERAVGVEGADVAAKGLRAASLAGLERARRCDFAHVVRSVGDRPRHAGRQRVGERDAARRVGTVVRHGEIERHRAALQPPTSGSRPSSARGRRARAHS